ncbi:MAG: hypothetical protein QG622_944 [Actinomycetota bacterium]|nr:hypothetical protein [Actinomycetota bacterium]
MAYEHRMRLVLCEHGVAINQEPGCDTCGFGLVETLDEKEPGVWTLGTSVVLDLRPQPMAPRGILIYSPDDEPDEGGTLHWDAAVTKAASAGVAAFPGGPSLEIDGGRVLYLLESTDPD